MNTFQPIGLDLASFNPFEKIGNEWMAITAGNSIKVNTMTASWGGAGVLWNKNVVFIFVRDSRYTKEFIDANNTFSINFFDSAQKVALKYFGMVSGRDEDKIANIRMNVNFKYDTPYIDESRIVVICRKLSATKLLPEGFLDPAIAENFYKDKDYHTMYVGEIVELMAR
ncbi:MAG: flavin reductase [Lachnospiraceae bacterium]|nr:flavin reductase [Lachnospiraceae bacterium]